MIGCLRVRRDVVVDTRYSRMDLDRIYDKSTTQVDANMNVKSRRTQLDHIGTTSGTVPVVTCKWSPASAQIGYGDMDESASTVPTVGRYPIYISMCTY